MTIIHMETEQVRELVRKVTQFNGDLAGEIISLRRAKEVLAMGWTGDGATLFEEELQDCIRCINLQAIALDTLVRRLSSELDEWEQADQPDGESFSLGGAWKKAKSIGGAALQGGKNSAKWIGSKAKSGAIWVTSKVKGGGEKKIPLLDLTPVTRAAFETKWDGMNKDQKIDYLQKLHNTIAVNYNFPPTTIKSYDLIDPKGQDSLGVRRANEIVIDIDNLKSDDPWAIQEVIAHETRHEMQHYLVDHPNERPSSITKSQLKGFDENFDNYHKPTDDFQAYWNQPVESDARTFADSFVDALYK